ncbi:MAG TPA: phospholipase D-like domain-containing protein [Fibrobacteria bacterium]|nr:phospholipase D-like domain-containing protein [Fibrobacteria bacterium]
MSTKFFTNSEENCLLKRFEGVFTHCANLYYFEALVGYFRTSGYFRIRPFLDKLDKIRILVGINVDKLAATSHAKGLLFLKSDEETKKELMLSFIEDIRTAKYDKETEEGILRFIQDLSEGKLEMRAHPHRKLHAKIYIFRPKNFNEYTSGEVITGSSNFTDQGVGYGDYSNYEFNVALRDYADVKFAYDEFETMWEESVEVLAADVKSVKQKTHLTDEYTPYEIFLKLLVEYFGSAIEYDPSSASDMPPGYHSFSYQIDAVNDGYNKMMKHGGFFLADVVGLGKTIIAALIAKKFWLFTVSNG